MSISNKHFGRFARLGLLVTVAIYATPAVAAEPQSNGPGWQGLIGPGLMIEPRFPGADGSVTLPVPIVDLRNGPFFVRSTRGIPEAGWSPVRTKRYTFSGLLGFERGRSASDLRKESLPDHLKVSPHLSTGAMGSVAGSVGPVPLDALVRARYRLGPGEGWLVETRLTSGLFETKRAAGELYVQGTWANHQAQAQDFPSTVSVPHSRGSSGVREGRLGISTLYRVTHNQGFVIQLERRTLHGTSRDSPLSIKSEATAFTAGYFWQLR